VESAHDVGGRGGSQEGRKTMDAITQRASRSVRALRPGTLVSYLRKLGSGEITVGGSSRVTLSMACVFKNKRVRNGDGYDDGWKEMLALEFAVTAYGNSRAGRRRPRRPRRVRNREPLLQQAKCWDQMRAGASRSLGRSRQSTKGRWNSQTGTARR